MKKKLLALYDLCATAKAVTALVGGRTLLQQAAEIGDCLLEQVSLLLDHGWVHTREYIILVKEGGGGDFANDI